MTEDNVFYVGVDVSKARHAIAIAEGGRNGEVRYFGEIEGMTKAVAKIVSVSTQNSLFTSRNRASSRRASCSTRLDACSTAAITDAASINQTISLPSAP